MYSSEIIARARSLADIQNSKFITNTDEENALFEAYKDVYSKITDSSDDYYIKTAILDLTTATKINDTSFEIDMPTDCYKIRFVDFKNSGDWQSMDRFNTNQRNERPGKPQYRWRGTKLWIIAGSLPDSIRIDYYPPAEKPSVPETKYNYLTKLPAYTRPGVTSPWYVYENNLDYMLYVLGGTTIHAESVEGNTDALLYTGTALSNIQFYAGYLYFISGGDIYRGSTDFAATVLPTAILSGASVTSFTITNGQIYYTDGASSYYCAIDGTGSTLIIAAPRTNYCKCGADLVYLDASGFIVIGAVTTTISALSVASDGAAIYYLTAAEDVYRLTGYGLTTEKTTLIDYAVDMEGGQVSYAYLTCRGSMATLFAVSAKEDTNFDYPLNEAPEAMAFQCAIDFRRKQNGDTTQLIARGAEIVDRMMNQLKRDEYQPEHRVSEFNRPLNY